MHRIIRPALIATVIVVAVLTAACGSDAERPTLAESTSPTSTIVDKAPETVEPSPEPEPPVAPEPEPEPEPVETVAPTYPTTPPSTTAPPTYPVTGPGDAHREALTRAFVEALNAGDLDAAGTIANDTIDTDWLSFIALEGPFAFEICFVVGDGSPVCNAASDSFGLSFGFTDDGSAIAFVDGTYFEGL